MTDLFSRSAAGFSQCKTYRYWLTRHWADELEFPTLAWILLNPSTADAAFLTSETS